MFVGIDVRVAELGDVVVLHAVDAEAVPEVFLRQHADLRDVFRREVGRKFVDDRAFVQLHVEQVGRVNAAPGVRRSAGDDVVRAAVGLFRFFGEGGRGAKNGTGQGEYGFFHGLSLNG